MRCSRLSACNDQDENTEKFRRLVAKKMTACHFLNATMTDLQIQIGGRNLNCRSLSCQRTLGCFNPILFIPPRGQAAGTQKQKA